MTARNDLARKSSGFTLLEILLVVAVIGLLVAVALPQYKNYSVRSQASELALKYDAIRTTMQVAAKTGDMQPNCTNLADTVNRANLQSDFANLAVDFEAVAGGYVPVLTMCATVTSHGVHGVEVTREAHNLLDRNGAIGQGAVIGDSAVSFAAKLVENAALCKTLPSAGVTRTGCKPGLNTHTAGSGGSVTPGMPASSAAPNPGAQQVVLPVQGAPTSTLAPGTVPVVPPVQSAQKVCPPVTPHEVSRQVMSFGSGGTGFVTSFGNLDTHGDMHTFSAEVIVPGGQRPGANAGSATLLSYSVPGSSYEFTLWNPRSVHLTFAGLNQYDTGIAIDDGKSHRLTVSWQSSDGALVLYDNGAQVWRQTGINTNGVLTGGGKLMIGQAPPGMNTNHLFLDGYRGSIVTASLGDRAISPTQASAGPLHTVLDPNSGLIANVVMDSSSRPLDTTGHTIFAAGGDIRAQGAMVNTAVYVDSKCQ